MAKHPSKTIRWKIKSISNWVFDKWMRLGGYVRYGYDFKNNEYIYERKEDVEKWEQGIYDE